MQNADGEWSSERCIFYHSYQLPENGDLLNGIAFGCGGIIALKKQPRMKDGFDSSSESKDSESRLFLFVLEKEIISEDD